MIAFFAVAYDQGPDTVVLASATVVKSFNPVKSAPNAVTAVSNVTKSEELTSEEDEGASKVPTTNWFVPFTLNEPFPLARGVTSTSP